jgi:hypothetical protein
MLEDLATSPPSDGFGTALADIDDAQATATIATDASADLMPFIEMDLK